MKVKRSLIFFLIIILGFFIRIYKLGYRDFWFDEIYSIYIAKNPANFWHLPIYYSFLRIWINIFGLSEFSLRFPSLLFSLLCIPLSYLFARNLFDKKTALISCSFISFSPIFLWYAQEVRPYSFCVFLGIVSNIFLYKWLKKDKKYKIFFIISSICGLYSHRYYLFLLLAQISFLFFYCKKIKETALILLILFLAFSLQLNSLIARIKSITKNFWIPQPELISILYSIENFNLGYNCKRGAYIISDLLLLFIFSNFLFSKEKIKRESLIFIYFLFILPILSLFFFSKLFFSIYLDRGLLLFCPYYFIFLAYILSKIDKKLFYLSLFFFYSLSFYGLYAYYSDSMPTPEIHHRGVILKKPFRPAVYFLFNNFRNSNLIAHTNYSTYIPFVFYSPNKSIKQYYLMDPKAQDPYWEERLKNTTFCLIVNKAKIDSDVIWLICSNWQRDGNLDQNSIAVKKFLESKYILSLVKEFDGIFIYKYEKF